MNNLPVRGNTLKEVLLLQGGFSLYYNFSKVEICGVNTSKLKTLTDEEKHELLLRTKNGDAVARRTLIDGNLRLVLSILQRFSGRNDNPDDLFQVGCIGLIKSIDNFNTDLDVKFSTYAVPMNIHRRKARGARILGCAGGFLQKAPGPQKSLTQGYFYLHR